MSNKRITRADLDNVARRICRKAVTAALVVAAGAYIAGSII